MTEAELNKYKEQGKVAQLPPGQPAEPSQQTPLVTDFEMYLAVLEALQRPRRHLTTAPTFRPRNFAQQIQFYDDGTARRIYFYVNGTWRYNALT